MIFSSLTFLGAFLPLTALFYLLSRNRVWRNGVLLAASLVFYAWGEPRFILLLLLATAEAYLGGLLLEKHHSRAVLAVTVTLLVGNLAVFKYLGFFCENLSPLIPALGRVPALALPIGISFYTFQILSYVIDLYRGKVSVQRNFLSLLLYVSFFPQLIAGPIVRYETVEAEIRDRSESLTEAAAGLRRFIRGLAKKVLLANTVALLPDTIYAGDPAVFGTMSYWLAALGYTLQIYFDFSGYSDMAIGLGRMFGFHFLENFDYPYVSRSVTEFWRRWHISLSSWFRDYVYIPLGGNRVKKGRWIFNLLVVWALTGFWHGAQWNFILWGLYYALLLLIEKLLLGKWLEKLPSVLRWVYTFFFVNLGWVLFDRTDFAALKSALHTLFVWRPTDWAGVFSSDLSLLVSCLAMIPALAFSFPILRR
ncbi:MAG: MBOAT family protein, partial [Oscillospiraceae bacterium]|nr:MBOAT family protein [Oscillospiraceae bacterium]